MAAAVPALAGEMSAEEARRFVTGKMFNYECFEGTRGEGRVYADGSVVGSIQFQGAGPVRYAHLPPGTLRVKGESVCASLRGLPIHPCFTLNRTSETSFRGAIYGLGFASCQFTRHTSHAELGEEHHVAEAARAEHARREVRQVRASEPLGLRPSLAAGAE
jgi:hypothetical protein